MYTVVQHEEIGDTRERRSLELILPSRSNKSYSCNNRPSRPSSTTYETQGISYFQHVLVQQCSRYEAFARGPQEWIQDQCAIYGTAQ